MTADFVRLSHSLATMTDRERRNMSVAMVALAQDRPVRFTYVNREGVTRRRTVKPLELRPTKMGVVLTAQDTDGPKCFRFDRMSRAQIQR